MGRQCGPACYTFSCENREFKFCISSTAFGRSKTYRALLVPYTHAYTILLLANTFLPFARLFFCWRDFYFAGATFFLLARLFFCWRDFFFAGATFFCWRDFFFAGATFFCWRDFFLLARLFFCWRDFFGPLLDFIAGLKYEHVWLSKMADSADKDLEKASGIYCSSEYFRIRE